MDHHTKNQRLAIQSGFALTPARILLIVLVVMGFVIGSVACRQAQNVSSQSLRTISDSGYVPAIFGSPFDPTPTPTATPTPTPSPTPDLPPVPTLGPPLPAPIKVVAQAPVDFAAARATAQAQGLDIAFVKIGFHRAATGKPTGFGDYLRKLNDAGVPVFLKSVDAGGPLFELQQLMKANEAAGRFVDHTIVHRDTDPLLEGIYYNLNLSPEEAAAISWQANLNEVPRELEKGYFWLETLNEPGRFGYDGQLQIERLGRFSLATAKLAVEQGYKYAALGFSFGVPEKEDWEHPAMLEFLRYAAEHPDQVAVALHEYSGVYEPNPSADPPVILPIADGYPYRVGRFQDLFDICDKYGIARPTVLITEWGWGYRNIPSSVEQAMLDIDWASWLYAAYPTVKGASIWYLGKSDEFGDIDNQTQRLIAPLADYAASHYFIIDPGIGRIDPSIFLPPGMSRIEPRDSWNVPTPVPQKSYTP